MEDAAVLEPFELQYADLMLLSALDRGSSSSSKEENKRLESITRTMMENLGPFGPGLLSITGVSKAYSLRNNLLPLASKLALLNDDHRKKILKEHGLGSDVSLKNQDRSVSSFAMQLKYVRSPNQKETHESRTFEQNCIDTDSLNESEDNEFKSLGHIFKELGFCMMELGLCLARICDKATGGQELEQSILESCSAKGRLIHYHSYLDNFIIKESARKKKCTKKPAELIRGGSDLICKKNDSFGTDSSLWQQWHYDYGIFTVLTAPLFLSPCSNQKSGEKDCSFVSIEHTCLQIFDPVKNKIFLVKASPESFIIQVGESADVLSQGKLRSTLHCVCRPAKLDNLSREMFVVFLQPAWSKVFSMSDHSLQCAVSDPLSERKNSNLTQEIHKIVPPLSLRLKDGMTFAEFSRETTKQYYGTVGLQSKR